ncbi:TetR family transcriptional regulator [Mycobacterium alsense]|uniref:TetR family transcriptional regulator n=1 Tax=Mycobacterium alsense TaxID=324058 RepID=A0ABD6P5N4_9MYCO|nr:TetR/AcrR family transcriptional regulator [Mycobacterium alsense]OBG40956.1 TetR family transcriptional regulator [Mycobacterium alsense]
MTTARRGRPTRVEATQLKERLREGAVSAFLEYGYDGATMEAIARAAGITKRTLYARYPDKRAVFLDVIPWAFSRAVDRDLRRKTNDDDLEAALTEIGRGAVKRALDPDTRRLHRVVMNETGRFPEFAVSAETLGWSRRQRQVMDLLRHHQDKGAIQVDDIELAAEHFLAMVEALPARLADFGVYRSKRQEERHLKLAVKLFLHGVLTR